MGGNWKQWAQDKSLRKWFNRDNCLILILTGILLVIIALPTKEGKDGAGEEAAKGVQRTGEAPRETQARQGGEAQPEDAQTAMDEDALYAADLEERLTQALSGMADVGEVRVMITLKASREQVVEMEQPVRRSSTNESDSLGGSRSVSEVDSSESTVYRKEGDLSEPYVVKTLPPKIEGVLVVAQGAGQGNVNRTIVEIAQALFGIEAHKVKVVQMAQKEAP